MFLMRSRVRFERKMSFGSWCRGSVAKGDLNGSAQPKPVLCSGRPERLTDVSIAQAVSELFPEFRVFCR